MKKKYEQITGDERVVRRCGNQVIERDIETDRVVGLFPDAMMLRTNRDEQYLSVNWLEHCAGTKEGRLKAIIEIYRKKKLVGRRSGIATLAAGRVLEVGSDHDRKLIVRFTPERDDPSYSRISGLPLDNSDKLLVAALASEAYKDFILISDFEAKK